MKGCVIDIVIEIKNLINWVGRLIKLNKDKSNLEINWNWIW